MQAYNKLWVALTGAVGQFVTLSAGCTDLRIHGVVALLTAAGVFAVPNK